MIDPPELVRLAELISRLRTAGILMSSRELEDALWLCSKIDPSIADTRRLRDAHGEARLNNTGQTLKPSGLPIKNDGTKLENREPKNSSDAPSDPTDLPLYPVTAFNDKLDAIRVRTPDVTALPGARQLIQALRPLKRRVPSRKFFTVDEDATVERFARGEPFAVALRPISERWLDLTLIVDQGASMRVWRPALRALRKLFETSGIFRNVKTYVFDADGGQIHLYHELAFAGHPRRTASAREIKPADERGVILVLSDALAAGWSTNAVASQFKPLATTQPMAMLHMLPKRMWPETAIGQPRASVRGSKRGSSNARLTSALDDQTERNRLVSLPVLEFRPLSLNRWAKVVAGEPGVAIDAVSLESNPEELVDSIAFSDELPTDANAMIADFRASASPSAFNLAVALAASPLTMPVMRLVQRVTFVEPQIEHLAEVYLGGLLKQLTPIDAVGDSEEVLYDFHMGVRERLLSLSDNNHTRKVLHAVSEYVETHAGKGSNMAALLGVPGQKDADVPANAREFARIKATVLPRIGVDDAVISEGNGQMQVRSRHRTMLMNAIALVNIAQVECTGFFISRRTLLVDSPLLKRSSIGEPIRVTFKRKIYAAMLADARDERVQRFRGFILLKVSENVTGVEPLLPTTDIPKIGDNVYSFGYSAKPKRGVLAIASVVDHMVSNDTHFTQCHVLNGSLSPMSAGAPALLPDGRVFGTVSVWGSEGALVRTFGQRVPPQPVGEGVRATARVLVVGTGTYELPHPVQRVSELLGRRLGEAGYELRIGCYQGVDHIVADTFVKAIGGNASRRLFQYTETGETPDFHGELFGGTVVEVPNEESLFTSLARDADITILIGGLGGAMDVAKLCSASGKLALPIAGTGGDAKTLHNDLALRPRSERGLSDAFLALLGAGANSDVEVEALVDDVMAVLRVVTDQSAALLHVSIAKSLATLILAHDETLNEQNSPVESQPDVLLFLANVVEAALPSVEILKQGSVPYFFDIARYITQPLDAEDFGTVAFQDVDVSAPWILKTLQQLLHLRRTWLPAEGIMLALLESLSSAASSGRFSELVRRAFKYRPEYELHQCFDAIGDQSDLPNASRIREVLRVMILDLENRREREAQDAKGQFIVRITTLAHRYLSIENWGLEGDVLWSELEHASDLITVDVVQELLTSKSVAHRVAGYFGVEFMPSKTYRETLNRNIDIERDYMVAESETRPMWRLLHVLSLEPGLPGIAVRRLITIDRALSSNSKLDPGNECRTLLSKLLKSRRGSTKKA